MLRGLWSRLSLRGQTTIAVLAPCLGVALFSALYFPQRLNTQAEEALLHRARTLGALASAAVAPTLKLIGDGLGRPEDLDHIFLGALAGNVGESQKPSHLSVSTQLEGTELLYLTVLKGSSDTLIAKQETMVRKAVQTKGVPLLAGATFRVPRARNAAGAVLRNHCEIDSGEYLLVRCFVKDSSEDALEGLFVAAVDKTALRAAQDKNLLIGLWSGLGAASAGLILALLFSAALAGPVQRVTEAARELAGGDVTVSPVSVEAAGELGLMANSFNEMLVTVRTLVGQMVELTRELAGASRELLNASTEQGNLSGHHATYAQEMASTFEELSRTAELISTSTDTVEGTARHTHEAVEGAAAVFTQLIADISATRMESKAVSDSIRELNGELREVSMIALLINSFAERSDILALNAALEGTKAGEVGRGFSLVAAELRRLSENVAGSARDITRIVEKVQATGNSAMTQALSGVVTSDKRAEIASKASQVFEEIFSRVRGTTEAAQRISIASKEQRSASEAAAEGARNVSQLVKQGVDANERTQQIARQLQSVADALSRVTRRFKVGTEL